MTASSAKSADRLFNSGRFAVDGADPAAADDISALPYERRLEVLNDARDGSLYIGFGFFVRVSHRHLRPHQLVPLRWVGDDVGDKAILALKAARGASLPHVDSLVALMSMSAHVACAKEFVDEAEIVPPWVDWNRVRRGQEFFLRNSGSLCIALLNLALIGGFGAPKINAVLQATGYLTRGKGTQRRLSETLQMVLDCIPEGALRPGSSGWRSVLNVRLLHAGVRTWLVGSQQIGRMAADIGVSGSHDANHAVVSQPVPAAGSVLRNRTACTNGDRASCPSDTVSRTPQAASAHQSAALPAQSSSGSAGAHLRSSPTRGPDTQYSTAHKDRDSKSSTSGIDSSTRGCVDATHFDVAAYGIPINQEDLLVTQLAFSIVLLIGLERLGLLDAESDDEMECYLHMWRYIGHLMGVHARYNGPDMDCLSGAQAMLESIASHVVAPEPCAREITMHVLSSVSHKPPLPRSPLLHVALTRMLAGEWYADALGIPHLTDPDLLALHQTGQAELRKLSTARGAHAPERGHTLAVSPGDEVMDVHHGPSAGSEATAVNAGSATPVWPSANATLTAMRGRGIAAGLWMALAMLRGASWLWSLLTWALAAVLQGRRAPPGMQDDVGVEAATAAARAQADARAVIVRLRIVQWFTHLPWIGLPIARLMLSGAVRMVEMQLGGRTHFPVRQRYL